MARDTLQFTPRRYRVRHATTYSYDEPVDLCYERGPLAPRRTPTQRVVDSRLAVDPEPDLVTAHVDHFGNRSHYLEIRTPHRRLEVVKTSVVEVDRQRPDLTAWDRLTVAQAARALREATPERAWELAAYRLPSTKVPAEPAVADYARDYLPSDAPLGEALMALTRGIHADFRFDAAATTVRTSLAELLQLRAGVCQDFTHLAIGALRSVGLPARYVSGYLETTPAPGTTRLAGSDVSHAWVSVAGVDGTWVDLDPTNDHLADSRYVVTAWGRDYRDVSPLKGVIHTEATTSALEVAVDVERLD